MDIQQIIKDRMKVLPDEIKQVIKSTDFAIKFNVVADKHDLRLDQNGRLQTETILVMLGLETTDDFVRNIERELEISRNEAIAITMDINREIFNPIRSSLQKMQEEENTEPEKNPIVNQPPTTPQTPITPQTPEATEAVATQTNNTLNQNAEPPVFVAKTIAIPKPEPVAIPAIRPKTLEEVGRFTIEKPPVGIPQYKDESIKKEVILGMIEDKKIEEPEPMKISVPSYIPEKNNYTPPTPTPAPVQTNIVTPTTKSQPQTEKKSYTVDPYREQI